MRLTAREQGRGTQRELLADLPPAHGSRMLCSHGDPGLCGLPARGPLPVPSGYLCPYQLSCIFGESRVSKPVLAVALAIEIHNLINYHVN